MTTAAECPPGAGTTKFAVIFVGQAGSGWLVSLVNQLEGVFVADEVLADVSSADVQDELLRIQFTTPLPGGGKDPRYAAGLGGFASALRLGAPSLVLPAHRLSSTAARDKECARAVGLKIKTHDLRDPQRIAELLQQHGAKVIKLIRRDLLKHAVSIDRANMLFKQRKVWHIGERGTSMWPVAPYAIPIKRVKFWLKDLVRRRRVFVDFERRVLDLPGLTVSYEDLLADPGRELRQVAQFLGAPWPEEGGAGAGQGGLDLKAGVGKNTADEPWEVVLNWDEIRRELPALQLAPDSVSRPA